MNCVTGSSDRRHVNDFYVSWNLKLSYFQKQLYKLMFSMDSVRSILQSKECKIEDHNYHIQAHGYGNLKRHKPIFWHENEYDHLETTCAEIWSEQGPQGLHSYHWLIP